MSRIYLSSYHTVKRTALSSSARSGWCRAVGRKLHGRKVGRVVVERLAVASSHAHIAMWISDGINSHDNRNKHEHAIALCSRASWSGRRDFRAGAVKKWITNHDAKTNRPSRNGQLSTVQTDTGAVADLTSSSPGLILLLISLVYKMTTVSDITQYDTHTSANMHMAVCVWTPLSERHHLFCATMR